MFLFLLLLLATSYFHFLKTVADKNDAKKCFGTIFSLNFQNIFQNLLNFDKVFRKNNRKFQKPVSLYFFVIFHFYFK